MLIVPQRNYRSAGETPKVALAVALGVSTLFAVVTAFGTVDRTPSLTTEPVLQPLRLAPLVFETPADTIFAHEDQFGRGDTFSALLARLNVRTSEIFRLLANPVSIAAFRELRPGAVVQAHVRADGQVHLLRFVSSDDKLVGFRREDGVIQRMEEPLKLQRQILARAARIERSFFAAADNAGVPDAVATQLAEVFGAEFDFHRDFKAGDRFTAVFEAFFDQGRMMRSGRLLAAEVVRGQQTRRAIWFESGDIHGYYSPEGKSLRHAFLRSPLEFTRITSGFETRQLPGSSRPEGHKGIDYAAPTGTPIRVTGDGTVDFIGQQNGYGNVIIVKHQGDYSTLYAHLNTFAEGLAKSSRVAQGQTIGTVGQTGRATGPHLHYEMRIRGEYVDPLTVGLPSTTPIPTSKLAAFKGHATPLAVRLEMLKHTTLASAE